MPEKHLEISDLVPNARYDVLCVAMWIRNNRLYMKYEFTKGTFKGKTIIESRPFQVPWRIEGGDK